MKRYLMSPIAWLEKLGVKPLSMYTATRYLSKLKPTQYELVHGLGTRIRKVVWSDTPDPIGKTRNNDPVIRALGGNWETLQRFALRRGIAWQTAVNWAEAGKIVVKRIDGRDRVQVRRGRIPRAKK